MLAPPSVDLVDLSDLGFWALPFEERESAFALLRSERPIAHFEEPQFPFVPQGQGFWALTRHADVVSASRDPETFSAAAGSVLPDLPDGAPFSYLRSMIDMDDPQHAAPASSSGACSRQR